VQFKIDHTSPFRGRTNSECRNADEWEPPDMNKHEDAAKALKARLSELTGRVAEPFC